MSSGITTENAPTRFGELGGDFVKPGEDRAQGAECLMDVFRHGLFRIELWLLGEVADADVFGAQALPAYSV